MARRKGKPPQVRHDPDFKVKVVKTSIEKSLTGAEAEDLFGIGKSTWWKWKRIYEAEGEEALHPSNQEGRPETGGAGVTNIGHSWDFGAGDGWTRCRPP